MKVMKQNEISTFLGCKIDHWSDNTVTCTIQCLKQNADSYQFEGTILEYKNEYYSKNILYNVLN